MEGGDRAVLLTNQKSTWVMDNIPNILPECCPNVLFTVDNNFVWICPDTTEQVEVNPLPFALRPPPLSPPTVN